MISRLTMLEKILFNIKSVAIPFSLLWKRLNFIKPYTYIRSRMERITRRFLYTTLSCLVHLQRNSFRDSKQLRNIG
jgi:hypothetical protein